MRRAHAVTHSIGDPDPSGLSECDACADAASHSYPIALAIDEPERIADADTQLPPAAARDRQCAWTLTVRA